MAGCSKFVGFLGTTLGPHVVRAGERPARRCTPWTPTSRPHTARDLRKCVTAIFWGQVVAGSNCRARRGWAAPGGSNSATPRADVQLLGQPANHGRGIRLPIQPHRALRQLDGILAIRCQQNFLPRFTRSNLVRKSPENRGTTHRAQLRGFGYSDNDRVDPSDSVPRMPGWEARHGCILRGARVRDHPANEH